MPIFDTSIVSSSLVYNSRMPRIASSFDSGRYMSMDRDSDMPLANINSVHNIMQPGVMIDVTMTTTC